MSQTLQLIIDLVARQEVMISAHGYDEFAEDGILVRDVITGVREANEYQSSLLDMYWDPSWQIFPPRGVATHSKPLLNHATVSPAALHAAWDQANPAIHPPVDSTLTQ